MDATVAAVLRSYFAGAALQNPPGQGEDFEEAVRSGVLVKISRSTRNGVVQNEVETWLPGSTAHRHSSNLKVLWVPAEVLPHPEENCCFDSDLFGDGGRAGLREQQPNRLGTQLVF